MTKECFINNIKQIWIKKGYLGVSLKLINLQEYKFPVGIECSKIWIAEITHCFDNNIFALVLCRHLFWYSYRV